MTDTDRDKDGDRRSRWNKIASLLGARVPDEPPVADQTAPDAEASPAASPEPALTPPRAKQDRPRPARRAGDWDALCGELGIDTPRVVESPAEPEPAATARPDADGSGREADEDAMVSAPVEPRAPRRKTPSMFFPDRAEQPPRAEADATGAGWVAAPQDGADGPADLEADQGLGDRDLDDQAAPPDDESVGSASRRRRRRGRRRRTPADRDQAAERPSSRLSDDPGADEPLDVRGPYDVEQLDEVEAEYEHHEHVRPGEVATDSDEDDMDQASDSDRSRRVRRRSRRPTSRGPGRADADDTVGDADLDDHLDADGDDELDLDESDDDRPRDPRGSRAGRGDGTGPAKHKKIPTWEEAISVIVAANLEVRRRDGESRNRPRGNRRRGRGAHDHG